MAIMFKVFGSFRNAFRGLKEAYRRDMSFRLELFGGLCVAVFMYLFWPLRLYEFIFMILGYVLILMTELINTAFEQILERLHPDRHELIGIGKDIASAAVFMALVFLTFVGSLVMLRFFGVLP